MVVNNFETYIELLCRMHKSILHNDTERHFIDDSTEKETAMDSIARYPLVVLTREGFTYNGQDTDFSKKKARTLLIVDHVTDNGDSTKIQDCYNRCELIGDQFLRRMMADKRKRLYSFLTMFSLVGIEGSYVENQDDSLYGIALTLEVDDKFRQTECNDPFNSIE